MPSPQLEDGYTRLANGVLEALARHPFTQRQYAVLLAVIRLSYGFNRKDAVVSSAQLAALTGCAPENCRKTVRELESLGVLAGELLPEGKRLALVKDWAKWRRQYAGGEGQNNPGGRVVLTQEGRVETAQGEGRFDPAGEGQISPTYKDSSQKTVVVSNQLPPQPQNEGETLVFPPSLSDAEIAAARKLLHGSNGTAQKILDVLEASIQAGTVKTSPLSLLRALANRARDGTFDAGPGLHIAVRRDKADRERQKIEAARQAAKQPKDPAQRARNAQHLAEALKAINHPRRTQQ